MKGFHEVGGGAQHGEKTEGGKKQNENKEHAGSGTHLAASRSSSFLYSPRWLQKIMVSDNWLLTHTDHTQTHMIKQKEPHTHTLKDTNTHTEESINWGKTPSLFLPLLLLSFSLSPLLSFSAILTQCAPLWLRLP